jgi:hypothetical protein
MTPDESEQLIEAFNGDEMFRRRVISDRRLDGALRVIADLRAHEHDMLATMDQLVRAAALSDGFVERLRPRLQREPSQRQLWLRRAALGGLAVAAAIAAVFVGFGHRPAHQLAARPAAPVMARALSRPPTDHQGVAVRDVHRAILLLGADSDTPRTHRESTADEQLGARLEQLGFTVDVLTAEDPEPDLMKAVERAEVVVLSPSIATAELSDQLIAAPVPLVALETSAFSRLGLTGTAWKRDVGNIGGRTREVVISNPGHPLAAGLSGESTVLTRNQTLRWGRPGEEAIVVAHYAHEPAAQTAVFAYERGSHMPVGDAPARRVGLFLGNARVITTLNAEGWKLFDAAITWSAADRR